MSSPARANAHTVRRRGALQRPDATASPQAHDGGEWSGVIPATCTRMTDILRMSLAERGGLGLIPLREVPDHLPRLRRGKRVHISTIHRWATRGVRGVVLETVRVGGTLCTTPEMLAGFLVVQSGVPTRSAPPSPQQQTGIDRQLDDLGL